MKVAESAPEKGSLGDLRTIAADQQQKVVPTSRTNRLVGDRGSGMFPDVHRAPFVGAVLR